MNPEEFDLGGWAIGVGWTIGGIAFGLFLVAAIRWALDR